MSYIVQFPNSQTNTSNKFRVVDYDVWLAYVNGQSPNYPFLSFDTYEEACKACDTANGTVETFEGPEK